MTGNAIIGGDHMSNDLSPEDIRSIREKYGLSRRAFSQLLGIGEASLARYENGAKPTKANANLIRAAAHPRFMLECLNSDGDQLTECQRDKTERIVYAMVYFDEGGEVMDVNEMYMLTLEQEILNEHAASVMADIGRLEQEAEQEGDEDRALIFRDMRLYLAQIKPTIISEEGRSKELLAAIRGKIDSARDIAFRIKIEAA